MFNEPFCIQKSNIFKSQNDRKPIGSITSQLWFEIFCYLINIVKIKFF